MSIKRNVILIGMPASGKSSAGKLIAYKAGLSFIDTDQAIQTQHNKSIKEIFAQCGEAGFRRLEAQLLTELAAKRAAVISCGGGSVLCEEEFLTLKASGTVVWLRCSAQKIYDRVKNEHSRPLINSEDGIHSIERLLSVREPLYQKLCDFFVDTDSLSPVAVAEQVLRMLGQ